MRSATLSPFLRLPSRRRPHLTSPNRTIQTILKHAYSSTSSSSSSPSPPSPSSTFNPDTYLKLAKEKLGSQTPTSVVDTLAPGPSHLLTLSLEDYAPSLFPKPSRKLSRAGTLDLTLPQGHHLVYFPPQIPPSKLMSDGTDPAHCPGAPFVRRMWAGGSVVFGDGWEDHFQLDRRRAECIESVGMPEMKAGKGEGGEKVFVDVTRRYGPVVRGHERRGWEATPGIQEVRKLVFMREREGGAGVEEGKRRVVKMIGTPEFTFSLKPDATLLFHFSALSYNAHSIHLDRDYARNREGYKNLLVHGPLTLTLMLTALRASLENVHPELYSSALSTNGPTPYIKSIDYRNLAPLYVDEEMRVCARRTKQGGDTTDWDVWVEGPEGGLAVKGKAVTTSRTQGGLKWPSSKLGTKVW